MTATFMVTMTALKLELSLAPFTSNAVIEAMIKTAGRFTTPPFNPKGFIRAGGRYTPSVMNT